MNIIVARTSEHYHEAVELFKEYAVSLGIDLQFQKFDNELHVLPTMYGPPVGELWLVEEDGNFVGCAALRKLEEGICELKRMYIRPSYRGKRWGQELMDVALQTAQSLGYYTMRLDSLQRLEAAVKLYTSYGFQQISPYNFNPEADVVYFEKKLTL
jgi:putative acetyltransferase